MQKSQPFQIQHIGQLKHPGDVAPRPVEARNKSAPDRVAAAGENNGNCSARCLGSEQPLRAPTHHNDSNVPASEIGRHIRHLMISTFRPVVFDGDVFAYDKAGIVQALEECGCHVGERIG